MANGGQAQGAFTAVTDLPDEDRARAALRAAGAALQQAFQHVPHLHFARVLILDATQAGPHTLPPCLVLATIHDGERDAHLDQIAAVPELQALYGACGIEGDLRAHLGARSLTPLCFYNGHPGLSRELIRAAGARHNALQATLQQRLAELAPGAPTADALADLAQATAPTPDERAMFGAARVVRFGTITRKLSGIAFVFGAILCVVVPLALAAGLLAFAFAPDAWLRPALLLAGALLAGILLLVRLHELADAARDAGDAREAGKLAPMPAALAFIRKERPRLAVPNGTADHLRRVADEEDQREEDAHNHLTHCSVLKAGPARRALLWLVFVVVKLRARVLDREGKLGGIPSIHFARWVLIDPGKPRHRILFMSDYDGTWESYLGQFVDLASKGLTAVWSNAERFPRSWFVIGAGARQEQRFKLWTRLRQVETPVVYSHYPRLSVHAVRTDVELCKAWVDPKRDSREAASALALLQSPTRGNEHA